MPKLIIANWKMNPPTQRAAVKLANSFEDLARLRKKVDVVVCPPFPFLSEVGEQWPPFELGAQDIFWGDNGAFTGETSAAMVKSLGARYVILGHSERRKYQQETDDAINKKILLAFKAGLRVVLCVGEPLAIRRRGVAAAKIYVREQLHKDLKGVTIKVASRRNLAVVYEPLWTISTSANKMKITAEEAVEMIAFMKTVVSKTPLNLSARMIYGGSVNSQNAADFLGHSEIEGALIGAASLKPGDFKKIVHIAAKL